MSDHSSVASDRRQFLAGAAALGAASAIPTNVAPAAAAPNFELKYILGSCMYGYTAVAEIMPQVHKIGARAIDIWPMATNVNSWQKWAKRNSPNSSNNTKSH